MNIFAALFTSNFWMSGLAIARYVPHSFRVRRVDGYVFFTEVKRTEFRSRIERLTENALRHWGTMNVGQMLHHLNLACGGSLGFYRLPDESYLVSRTIFKWILVAGFLSSPLDYGFQRASKSHTRIHSTFSLSSSNCLPY